MSLRWFAIVALVCELGVASAAQPTKRPTDQERGKELYDRHCLACHGTRGAGDGPATEALVVPIPDLVGKVKADAKTIDLVEIGRGAMPGFQASFDADDAKRVLAWMSKLDQQPAVQEEAPAEAPPETPPENADAGEGPH